MKIFTILKQVIERIQSLSTKVTQIVNILESKTNKNWTYLGDGSGTLEFDFSNFTEMNILVVFGGVWTSTIMPSHVIGSSPQTVMTGYYGNPIYVEYSKTYAKITYQPQGYTARLYIYAR